MASPALLDTTIEKGARLRDELRSHHFPTSAMLWHLDSEEATYRLLIATPLIDRHGPKTAYGLYDAIVGGYKPSERVIRDAVQMVSQNHHLIRGLRQLRESLGDLENTWLYTTPLQDSYFNEGYVYFVSDPVDVQHHTAAR